MVTGDSKWFNETDGKQPFPSFTVTTEHFDGGDGRLIYSQPPAGDSSYSSFRPSSRDKMFSTGTESVAHFVQHGRLTQLGP